MPFTPEIIAQSLWPGAAVERSIFGTGDPAEIRAQVRETWPEAVDCFAFEVSVGATPGVVLADGSPAALKVHRHHSEERLRAVQRVQAHLHGAGFRVPVHSASGAIDRPAARLGEYADALL